MTGVPAFEIDLWNAWMYMVVFVVYIYIIFAIFRRSSERVAHGKEAKKLTTLLLPVTLVMLIYSIFLPLVRGTAWFYVGTAVCLVGFIFVLLSRADADAAPEGEPFTGGIYRYSRHPFYLGFFLVFLGTGIACASWLFIVLSVISMVMAHIVMIAEESSTLEKYGDSYRVYKERTPRWLGLPKSDKKPGIGEND